MGSLLHAQSRTQGGSSQRRRGSSTTRNPALGGGFYSVASGKTRSVPVPITEQRRRALLRGAAACKLRA